MLLLMATYGLRAIEVVSLVLDDIDWHRKTIHIRQDKTNKHLLLPLTDGIAEVLIDYLKTARPQVSHREVFLRAYAPIGRLDHSAVAKAFEREARLVGLDIPFRGTHYLRHSFAVHLLRQGASLKSIGDILGHRDAESTCVYLRLAVEDLRVVALEVPDDQPRDPGVAAVSVDKLPHYKLPARSTPPGPLRSSFGPQIGAYLELHHSLGKRFRSPERILRSLDYFLSVYSPEETALSHYSFNRWCNTLTDYMAKDRRSRMGIVRKFCLYLQRSQPDTFIPDILTFPSGQPKPSPFIVYPDGIGQVLHAIRSITPNSRYPSVREIMRLSVVLLFTTGIRRGELLRLRLADFNPAEATLFIRTTKFYKERVVPVSVTTVQEIEDYLVHCRQAGFDMSAELPLIRNGNPRSRMCYTGCGLGRHWRRVCASLGLLSQRGIPPRLHDLRHSFAVNALLRSYENGGEPQAILPQLSTYMGHGSVTSTYHYLAFVDPLRAVASARFEEKYGSLASQRSDVPVIQQESDNE
jgi:integrase